MEVTPTQGQSAGQYVATLDSSVTITADSTNILPSADQVSLPFWTISGGSVQSNTVTAPDGSMTADALSMQQNSGFSEALFQDFVIRPDLYDGATVTGSVYLKIDSSQTVNLSVINTYASGARNPVTFRHRSLRLGSDSL